MSEKNHEALNPELLATLPPTNVDDLLATVKYYVDEEFAHIKIKDQTLCEQCGTHPCLFFCPAGVFSLDAANHILIGYQACLECGSCRIGCPSQNVDWTLPQGGYGVAYKFG